MTDLVRGNPTSSVAICALSSHDLLAQLAATDLLGQVALMGTLETENTGIEQMLVTLYETPSIRSLILCGRQNPRRKQGDALRTLFATGVEADGEIKGLRGRKLPNLRAPHVDTVREQVQLEDLMGIEDVALIAEAVKRCQARPTKPLGTRPDLPRAAVAAIQVESRAFKVQTLDRNGYFVIRVDAEGGQLIVDHHGDDHALQHRMAGPDAESLVMAILEWGLVSRMEHAAYLGIEVTRAEQALRAGLPYIQDRRGQDAGSE